MIRKYEKRLGITVLLGVVFLILGIMFIINGSRPDFRTKEVILGSKQHFSIKKANRIKEAGAKVSK